MLLVAGFLKSLKAGIITGKELCKVYYMHEKDKEWAALRIEFLTANGVSFKTVLRNTLFEKDFKEVFTVQPANANLYSKGLSHHMWSETIDYCCDKGFRIID